MMDDTVAAAFPFFLDADPGTRFCLFHAPLTEHPRGAILYVPPFAEELNKCRRMAAMQSRCFAQAGYAVLQLDLYGCGDSDGDFGDARWHVWLNDIEYACRWLREFGYPRPALWGARLGALLALDFACTSPDPPPALILWQAALSGSRYIKQFLRVETAAQMLAPDGAARAAGIVPSAKPLEVAGYTLAPALIQAIGERDAAQRTPPCPVHWLEVDSTGPAATSDTPDQVATTAAVSPSSARQIEQWRTAGVPVTVQAVAGQAFWASTEIVLCPALLDATTTLELP
ncbi:hydrolase 2, exosortase A system-associated [Rugamonas apoptosis]|nr:hydrolase 2, exosortase A system-associated [Rugamonas apoptosis]